MTAAGPSRATACQFGGAEGVLLEETVGRRDLDGGGFLPAEEHGQLGSAGEVAEFGAFCCREFEGGLGKDGLFRRFGAETVEGTSDAGAACRAQAGRWRCREGRLTCRLLRPGLPSDPQPSTGGEFSGLQAALICGQVWANGRE
ncbi:hypothetical protein KCH_58220 [Kitasatospora cheerisanensis KCTC 2395]|uniref:Uncharacterized protein n=1 Tax=Kitasatospora cheerisanensis KCTC 2395 TaxID=1348663 RepID=A0A066YWL9_9ACTN|nr:hypothetical protein KCH_58220 [Kitasatospora cheerisanensis KCTC 2395]